MLFKWIRKRRLHAVKRTLTHMDESGVPYDRMWKLCEKILDHVKEKDFKHLSPPELQANLVRTPFKSLQTYNEALRGIQVALENEQKIERSWSSFEALSLSLSEFMVTEDGQFYMNRESLVELVRRGRHICQLINQAEDEEVGVMAHNQRVLIHFFVRYKDTLLDLFDLQFAL
ncbi:MAG: hypothetical protein P4L77_11325 [Sulfuriferula sp.]|nr:hypothetical protein [Sulfuriferula sp.]